MMHVSSRTPEGVPNRCPVCGKRVVLEPSDPARDGPGSHCGHLLWLTDTEGNEAFEVKLSGDDGRLFDAGQLRRLREQALRQEVPTRLVLDLSGITFISSEPLGEMITLHEAIKEAGGSLKLRDIQPEIHDLFRITRLDKLFEVQDG